MKNKLIFTVSQDHQYQYDDCIVFAKDAKPKWFVDQPLYIEGELNPKMSHEPREHKSLGGSMAISGCPAVRDYYETGYIVKCWTDLLITKNEFGEIIVQTPSNQLAPCEFLSVDKMIPISKNHNFKNPIIRLVSYIEMSATKNTSLLQLSCLDDYPQLKIFEGMVPIDRYPVELKVPFAIVDDFEEIFIPYGTPLLRLIPIDRNFYNKEKVVVEKLKPSSVSRCPFFKLGKYLSKWGWIYSRNLYK